MRPCIRFLIIFVAAVILVVLLPMARGCIEPHAIQTTGPQLIEPPEEPVVPALNPDRGPGTGAAQGEDPAKAVRAKMVFDQRAQERPPAQFDHLQHAARDQLNIACTDCHHKSEGTQVNFGCSTCHRDAHSGSMFSAKAAQHKSCVGCHLEANAEPSGLRDAPVDCDGCHLE